MPVFRSKGQRLRLGLCSSRWTAALCVGTGPHIFC